MKKSTKIALFALCVFSSFLQGWITLEVHTVGVWLLYFGIVGAIPFLLSTEYMEMLKALPG